MQERIEEVKRKLAETGHKLTMQREATMRVLIEHEEAHMTAEDVYMHLKQTCPDIGLATVYRTLELLSEIQIVEKVNFGDGAARFDLRSSDRAHHHHHMICRECGQVEEIHEDWLLAMESRVEREYGFTVIDHRLDFQGICASCRSAAAKAGRAVS
ncbi:Fur family transcriptional regulator [Paenibacillus beijingensis]|uniref:Fur family transcriptional regulator n=1 Tax=Paenibacillus beijingensis TaxID=1126833 RepID=A0A0D5NR57_9BACL|nr:Fur family transcriptional regulator [Paenibacillus beijingensis]AJY77610.1 Fur family transcriptional regulator [Paenibacillus beijingensis]